MPVVSPSKRTLRKDVENGSSSSHQDDMIPLVASSPGKSSLSSSGGAAAYVDSSRRKCLYVAVALTLTIVLAVFVMGKDMEGLSDSLGTNSTGTTILKKQTTLKDQINNNNDDDELLSTGDGPSPQDDDAAAATDDLSIPTKDSPAVVAATPPPSPSPPAPPEPPATTTTNNDDNDNPALTAALQQSKFQKAKEALFDKLRVDYGPDIFEKVFFRHDGISRGRTLWVDPAQTRGAADDNLSWTRLVRKFKIKLLEALVVVRENNDDTPVTTLVWASGGHSAAASHGNFFNQSYTAYLEQALKPVFAEAFGIQFQGRNYAVGGSNSGPEVALCSQAIYGTDVDILSWDHGMTDSRLSVQQLHYMFRAGINGGNRPAVIMLPHNTLPRGRQQVLQELQDLGMATLYMWHDESKRIWNELPETVGLGRRQILQLGKFVQKFKCNGRLEDGDDLCKNAKFDMSVCTSRKFRVSWHPGWKWHALHGNLMAMLILELVQDALNELSVVPRADWKQTLGKLLLQEMADYSKLLQQPLPDRVFSELRDFTGTNPEQSYLLKQIVFTHPLVCHTAWLPAQSRYMGLVTEESEPIADVASFETMEITSDNIRGTKNPTETLRLVAEMKERQVCPVLLNIDHRDYWYLSHEEGSKSIEVPNQSELDFYNKNGMALSGLLAVCFVQTWGNAPQQEIIDGIEDDERLQITVNGAEVTGLSALALNDNTFPDCYLLRNVNNKFGFPLNEQGRFTFKITVTKPGQYVKFSSLIAFVTPEHTEMDDKLKALLAVPMVPPESTDPIATAADGDTSPDSAAATSAPPEPRQDGMSMSMDYYQSPQAVVPHEDLPRPVPISDKTQLVQRLETAKQAMFAKLQQDYGDYFAKIFLDGSSNTRARSLFVPPEPGSTVSWSRLTRKLQIKLLQALTSQPPKNDAYPKFVWVVGGHSAAASHGNFYNESYAIYLQNTIAPVFAALGVEMIGRNYAVGSSQSAPEIAWCMESMFGLDADVVSWDFGMTDGRENSMMQMYAWHAGAHRNRPALVVIPQTNPRGKEIGLKEMEDRGLTAFYLLDEEMKRSVHANIPETVGLSQAQIDAMPKYVRAFKCNGRFEEGDDLCADAKWDGSFCDKRGFRTSWHPGWKWHGLHGNLMAMLLLEVLQDAAKAIEASTESDLKAWLAKLIAEEEADAAKFRTSSLPESLYTVFKPIEGVENQRSFIDMAFADPLYCHTAWLPNEARYNGVMTGQPVFPFMLEKQLVDKQLDNTQLHARGPESATVFQWQLEGGQLDGNLIQRLPPNDTNPELRLVAELKERQNCPVLVNIDHRDYWFLSGKEGEKELTLPNTAEQAYFNPTGLKPRGVIAYCYQVTWGKGQANQLYEGNVIADKRLTIIVNNVRVTGLSNFSWPGNYFADCHLLRHSDAQGDAAFEFPPNNEGRFVIKLKVEKENEHMNIATFVTWLKRDSGAEGVPAPLPEPQTEESVAEPGPQPEAPAEPAGADEVPSTEQAGGVSMGYFQSPQAVVPHEELPKPVPITDTAQLLQRLGKAEQALFEKLEQDYGDYFEKIFLTEDGSSTRARSLFVPPQPGTTVSWSRLTRKLQIKLLQALTAKPDDPFPKFVWVVGGHSAAASHGNFYNESYAIYLQNAIAPVFASLGVEMIGRNYAVGSSQSAPEIAWCMESMFGLDADVVSWDFGMTDGRENSMMQMYAWHAGTHRNRPAVVVIPQTNPRGRENCLKEMEDRGLSAFYLLDEEMKRSVHPAIPETVGLSQAQIDGMPKYVRAFKCNGRFEEGDDLCADAKWDGSFCDKRGFRTSWHPGWKWHGLHGNLLAMLLLEALQDAAKAIEASSESDLSALLQRLTAEEEADATKFRLASLPESLYSAFKPIEGVDNQRSFIDMAFADPLYCHTAWLPNEARYNGILTGQPVQPFVLEKQLVDKSLDSTQLHEQGPKSAMAFQWQLEGGQLNGDLIQRLPPNDTNPELRLVAELKERQNCPVLLNIDHRDYWFLSSKEGEKQLTLPNAAEQQYFNPTGLKPRGIIAYCYVVTWGKGQANQIFEGNAVANQQLSITVNDVKVTGLSSFSWPGNYFPDCHLLRHSDAQGDAAFEFPPNDDGRFVIKLKVEKENAYTKIATFVTWLKKSDEEAAVSVPLAEPQAPKEPAAAEPQTQEAPVALAEGDASTPANELPSEIKTGFYQIPQAVEPEPATPVPIPLTNKGELSRRLQAAKEALFHSLQQDYGTDYFSKLFVTGDGKTRGRTAFVAPRFPEDGNTVSWARMTRKLKIKLLQSLTRQPDQDPPVTFVWATGGHSAAASHGNFCNQSYTQYLEFAAQPLFAAVGMQFEGRNYAVGGSASAPEVAWCSQEIYGTDIDVISWDHGMTDQRFGAQMQLYFYRAALSPNRPAAIMLPHNTPHGGVPDGRDTSLKELEDRGMTTFYLWHEESKRIWNELPETVGLTQAQIDALPPNLRAFKCNGRLEDGEDLCKLAKFDLSQCAKRRFRVGWHPGWRWHALHGHLMTLFLLEHLQDAAQEIEAASDSDPSALLQQLQAEQEADYVNLTQTAKLAKRMKNEIRPFEGLEKMPWKLLQLVYQQPTVCHTAWLPAEARYLGLVNGKRVIHPYILEQQLKDKSITLDQIKEHWPTPDDFDWQLEGDQVDGDVVQRLPANESEPSMLLVAEVKERQKCNVLVNIDHRDYFFLHNKDGWKTMTVPTSAELAYYNPSQTKLSGLLAFCFVGTWGNGPEPMVFKPDALSSGRLSMTVNDQPVVGLAPFDWADTSHPDCHFLKRKSDGGGITQYQFTPNANNQFDIRIKVMKPNEYTKIVSFIAWL